jgi:carbamoyl-phosphate synthase large subunit
MAAPDDWSFPLIAKPARGSASIGVRTIEGVADLVGAADDIVVQARAAGHEYTVDVYVDLAGAVVEAVPRRRIEVRAGEVSKGRTERHGAATKVAGGVAERLAELGLRGPMNVQVFCDGEDVNVIEMNPRFGGGYPLAHHAGAHFTQWLVDETIGGKSVRSEGWTEGLVMLRYDAEVIVDGLDDAG